MSKVEENAAVEMISGKVIARKIVSEGRLVYTVQAKEQNWLVMMDKEAIQTAIMMECLPKVGDSVTGEPSINPATQVVSDEWMSLNI